MPTALDQAAERLAPTRAATNYFGSNAGQSVISRYANSGRRLADSELAAEAGNRLLQSRENRLTMRRNQQVFDRDEQEFQEKQDFKVQRGGFLEKIAAIDPNAEDFDDQVSELYRTLPRSAMDDDAVTDLLAFKKAQATDLRNERQAAARREEQLADRMSVMRMRYENDPRLSVLSPGERARFVAEDGEFDFVGAGQLAYEKTRANKKDDQLEVAATKRQWKIEDAAEKDLSDAQKELKALAREHATGDAVAFPSQVEALRTSLSKGGKPPKDEVLKKAPGYEAARRYDSNKFVSELESARNMGEQEYVAAGGTALDDTAKEKRRTVWRAAQAGTEAAPQAPAAAVPARAPGVPEVGFRKGGYVFKGGNPADKNNWEKE